MAKADTGAIAYYNDVAFHAVNLSEEEEIALFTSGSEMTIIESSSLLTISSDLFSMPLLTSH